ncbi:MAG: CAP domain-containing protein [Pyrinomonadaceae bacterium]
MRSPLYTILLGIALFAVPVLAQNGKPQPILVGVIGGVKRPPAAARTVNASFSSSSLGSANGVESRAFELMNAQRLANGLRSLEWDEELIALARSHSESMAEGKYFSHKDPNGGFVDSRAAKLGIFNWMSIGENIAFMKGYDDPAAMAVEKWMQSTSHKKNILSGQWRDSAIGVAVADDGSIYFTQVFIAK